jgi:enoyl-CoA hydratase/carnithine racemase
MNVVRFEQDGDVGSIVLCDPPNRVSRQYADDLREAVHQAGESRIRALLVRAEGADFSLGGATFEWPDKDRHWFRTFVGEVNASYLAIRALPVPVVMAVRGIARGGGFELALSGDFIVASETAVFWCLEVNSGMVPVAGAVQRLAGAAGHYHAARITMLGQPFTVAEAVALNLVTEVVPDEQLDKTALELARRLAAGPTRGLAAVKSLLKAQAVGEAVANTLMADLTMGLFETADARNALPVIAEAMVANRAPEGIEFTGS